MRDDHILCKWKRSCNVFRFLSVYMKKFLSISLGHETGIKMVKAV